MPSPNPLKKTSWATPLFLGIAFSAFAFVSIVGLRAISTLNQRVTALEGQDYVRQLERHIQGLGDQVLDAIRQERGLRSVQGPVPFDRIFMVIAPSDDDTLWRPSPVADEFAS